eukprot:15474339-Alexandrium_andersonii.AAC.1
MRSPDERATLPKIPEVDMYRERWRTLPALQSFLSSGLVEITIREIEEELNRCEPERMTAVLPSEGDGMTARVGGSGAIR